jgi:hypothetical protein
VGGEVGMGDGRYIHVKQLKGDKEDIGEGFGVMHLVALDRGGKEKGYNF